MNFRNQLRIGLAVLAVGFSTVAATSFTNSSLFASPLTTGFAVFAVGTTALAVFTRTDDKLLVYTGYVVTTLYSVIATLYLLDALAVDTIIRSVVLLVAAAGLSAGVYFTEQDERILTEKHTTLVAAFLLLTTAGVGVVDLTTPDPKQTVTIYDEPRVEPGEIAAIGEVTTTNPSVLPKTHDSTTGRVEYNACVSEKFFSEESDERSSRSPLPRDSEETIRRFPVYTGQPRDSVVTSTRTTRVEIPRLTEEYTFGVQTNITVIETNTSCPSSLSNDTIAVYPAG
jgi:hypothetical protein